MLDAGSTHPEELQKLKFGFWISDFGFLPTHPASPQMTQIDPDPQPPRHDLPDGRVEFKIQNSKLTTCGPSGSQLLDDLRADPPDV